MYRIYRSIHPTIASLFILVTINVQPVFTATLTVCPSGCTTTTIEDAVGLASDGDEIVISVVGVHVEEMIFIDKNLTIRGLGMDQTVLESELLEGNHHVFMVHPDVSVVLEDMQLFRDFEPTWGFGSAIRVSGELLIRRLRIRGFTGSAVVVWHDARLAVVESELIDNRALSGGAIKAWFRTTVEVHRTLFQGNRTAEKGGHVSSLGELRVYDSEFLDGFTDIPNDSYLETSGGGAIHVWGSAVIKDSLFSRNEANAFGSALWISGFLSLDRVAIDQGAGLGGAIALDGEGVLEATDLSVTRTTSSGCGGALRVAGNSTATVERGYLYANQAGHGGGACVEDGTAELTNVTVDRNSALTQGGAFWVAPNANLKLASSTVTGNVAGGLETGGEGGGIYVDETCSGFCAADQAFLRNTILSGNFALGPGATNTPNCSGAVTSEGYNFFGTPTGLCVVDGDATGVMYAADPELETTADNGGASSWFGAVGILTRMPFDPSIAVGAGDPTGCTYPDGAPLATDARGALRDTECDLGAAEFGSATPTRIFSDDFEGGSTLRWAQNPP